MIVDKNNRMSAVLMRSITVEGFGKGPSGYTKHIEYGMPCFYSSVGCVIGEKDSSWWFYPNSEPFQSSGPHKWPTHAFAAAAARKG